MKNMKQWLAVVCLIAGSTLGFSAETLVSGPPAGTQFEAVQCYANTGPYAGKESFDASTEISNGPGALLFIHVLNRNTAPVLRGFDHLMNEFSFFSYKGFVISLSGDRTAGEEMIRRVNGSMKLRNPIVLGLDGLEGPGSLALNRRCTLSLILVNNGKVTKSFGFTDTGLHDMERIRAAFEKNLGNIPESPRELQEIAKKSLPKEEDTLRTLAAKQSVELYRARQKAYRDFVNTSPYAGRNRGMTQRNNPRGNMERKPQPTEPARKMANEDGSETAEKPQRQGKPPEDPQLNSLLRAFIRKTHENQQVDELYSDITKRAGESKELTTEAVEMFKLMLSFPDRYGTEHAQSLAKKFLSKHTSR